MGPYPFSPLTQRLLDALRQLTGYAMERECRHETTKRGGAIWTLCDDCGAKWADDEGGFPGYTQAPEIKLAVEALREALRPSPPSPSEGSGAERLIEALEEELDSARQDLVDRSVAARLLGDLPRADIFLEASVIVGARVTDYHTERQLSALSASTASPEGAELGLKTNQDPSQAASTIERLTRERDEARAALQPFARIKPSSFYSEDGSEEEGYCVFLANQNAAATAFTGADLARARSVISSPRYQEAEND